MKKRFLLYCVAILAFCPISYAQKQTVTGTVKDASGPLVSASIIEKDVPENGAVAAENGRFTITLRGNSRTVEVRSVGHVPQVIKLRSGQTSIDVTLQLNDAGMDQVVVVGYGTKKRITNTGAVSSISADVVRDIPTSSVQNTLQGRLPGFFSVQRGGQPGKDASDFFIRGVSSLNPDGNKPLIIVDDIEYTYEQLSQINVNEIESLSILKDASTTAIYGIKGANGVLIVKTRRGGNGKPKVNARIEGGMMSPTIKPKFLNAFQTGSLVNEALNNDGLQPRFTQQDLDLFKSHQDPYGHPDVNWYDVVLKNHSLQANTNIDISGGTDNVKYFISAGAFTQSGNLHNFQDPRNQGIDNQYFYHRYNFRSNLDIQASKSLKVRLDVTGRFGQINQPIFYSYFEPQSSGIMQEIYDFHIITPYAAPVLNPNGSYAYAYGPNLTNLPTINARLATMGYNRNSRTDFNVLTGITEKMEYITQGLSFEARIAYASASDITRIMQREADPPSYHYTPADGSYALDKNGNYTLKQFDLHSGNQIYNKRVNLQAFLNYDRTFGDHHFYSVLLFSQDSYTSKDSFSYALQVPAKFQGLTAKVGYDYKKKYLFDFNMARNGSDRFQSDHRFGFFPAVGIGWNMAEENFFKKLFPVFQLFKLRGSYGIVGSDAVPDNRYLYQQFYNRGLSQYAFGESPSPITPIYEGSLANYAVTWEKARKKDIGLDINMLKDKLSITIDWFNDFRYDQLFFPGHIPSIIGVGFARENLASVRNHGWDGQVRYQDRIGKVGYDVTAVFSFAKNKIVYEDEATPAYPWLSRTGHPIGQPFGYTCIGFYTSADDITKSPKPQVDPSIIKPGDLKYKDLNGDGVINEKDMGAIGKPNLPNTSLGLTLGLHYKGFDLSVLFQGAFNYSFSIQGIGIEPFQSQMQPIHELRWTPDNPDAKFPRLTSNASGISSPTVFPSTFWLINAHYIRMKTVEIGYMFPQRMLPFRINNARLYFSGYNFLTWTNYNLYQQDPEVAPNSAGDAYLNQRVMNLGLQIGF